MQGGLYAQNKGRSDQGIETRIGNNACCARCRRSALRRISAGSESEQTAWKVRSGLFRIRSRYGERVRENGDQNLPSVVASGSGRTAGRDPGSALGNHSDHAVLQAREGHRRGIPDMERVRACEEGMQPATRQGEGPRAFTARARHFRIAFRGRGWNRKVRGLHRSSCSRKRRRRT